MRGLAVAVAAGCVALLAGAAPTQAAERPRTIPALREWSPGEGAYELRSGARIVVPVKHRRVLRETAKTFAADLRALTGVSVPVVSGRRVSALRGDIRLRLGARDPALGREGYRMRAGARLMIAANSAPGAFYATRTALQLMRQHKHVPAGLARDWPRYPERGLMVDIGRKHFTLAWLEARVRELAYLKLNQLHLHFTDNEGWRIESKSHPEVVSTPHLTREQVRGLIAYAARRHVRVIPEIDMPGHMRAALARHPELQLRDAFGNRTATNLDYSLPAARRFARELIDDYASLFPGRYFHIGADEYVYLGPLPLIATPLDYAPYPHLEAYARGRFGPQATVKDGFRAFVNEMNDAVRARGKTLRIWNDGIGGPGVVGVDPNVVVDWWRDSEDGTDPDQLVARGHHVLNAGWYPTYYVNGPTSNVPPRPDLRGAYETWSVDEFSGVLYVSGELAFPSEYLARDDPRNLGSELHIWNDDPNAATEAEIASGIRPRLRIIAQKTWDSPQLTPTWAGFEPMIGAIGDAPGD